MRILFNQFFVLKKIKTKAFHRPFFFLFRFSRINTQRTKKKKRKKNKKKNNNRRKEKNFCFALLGQEPKKNVKKIQQEGWGKQKRKKKEKETKKEQVGPVLSFTNREQGERRRRL